MSESQPEFRRLSPILPSASECWPPAFRPLRAIAGGLQNPRHHDARTSTVRVAERICTKIPQPRPPIAYACLAEEVLSARTSSRASSARVPGRRMPWRQASESWKQCYKVATPSEGQLRVRQTTHRLAPAVKSGTLCTTYTEQPEVLSWLILLKALKLISAMLSARW
jgi:hypothetical protein